MAAENAPKNANKNKVKMALIPLLGVVLIYMVFASRGGKKRPQPQQQAASGPAVATATATSGTETAARPSQQAAVPPCPWPNRSLAEILRFDPFQLRSPVVASTELSQVSPPLVEEPSGQDRERSQLVERFSRKVPEMVVRSRHGALAVIDGQTVREGDVLDGTVRVVAIRADEILFELLERE